VARSQVTRPRRVSRREAAGDDVGRPAATTSGVGAPLREEREFQHESLQDRESILAYLKALAEGFSTGTITFTDKDGEISLSPAGLVTLHVKANRKRGRVQLSFKLSWQDARASEGRLANLTIRTDNGRRSR
jgi:amphi-Trp domain-containing protein